MIELELICPPTDLFWIFRFEDDVALVVKQTENVCGVFENKG